MFSKGSFAFPRGKCIIVDRLKLEIKLCEILLIYSLNPPKLKNIQQVLNATKARHHETFDLAGYYMMPSYLVSFLRL